MDTSFHSFIYMAGNCIYCSNYDCHWDIVEGKVILLKFLDKILRRYCNLITWIGAVIVSILFGFVLYHGYMAIFGR